MGSELKLFLRYFKNLGLARGLVLFVKVEVFKFTSFKMPSYDGLLHLRSGTTDIKVFREAFPFEMVKMNIEGAELSIIIESHDWLKDGCWSAFFNAISKYNIQTEVQRGMLVARFKS
jgi:hypothetical protein